MDSNIIELITQVGTSTKVFINTFWPQWPQGIFTANCCLFGLERKNIFFFATPKWGHIAHSGRQNQRPIVPDEWHNHTGRVAVTVDLSDGRVAIIEQNTKQSNYLKLRISHTPDTISESWKLLWREQVISHM